MVGATNIHITPRLTCVYGKSVSDWVPLSRCPAAVSGFASRCCGLQVSPILGGPGYLALAP